MLARNQLEKNFKKNTIMFLIQNLRRTSHYLIKTSNLIIKINKIQISENNEEQIVNKFKKFNKTLLNFSKFTCGTTLSIYSNKYINHNILKNNIALQNSYIEFYNSIEKTTKLIGIYKVNSEYIKKYTEAFHKILNDTTNIFNENIKTIKSFCANNTYTEELSEILSIIKLIQEELKKE